jgi:putative nucleotidyltransferase with HDIG domain
MFSDHQKLQQIVDLGMEIARIHDLDVLLEKILSAARKLVNADAGTIYIKSGNCLKFSHTQNDTLQKSVGRGKTSIYDIASVKLDHHSIAGHIGLTGETMAIADVYGLDTANGPYTFDHSYDEKANYRTHSMLAIPLKNNQNQVIGVMELLNAQNKDNQIVPFTETDIPIVRVFANNAAMAIERAQMTRTEILGLVRVLTELRDPEETEAHVSRVGAFSGEIYLVWAQKKGLARAEIETNVETLRMAAMLHDIGKLAVPYSIREKPGRFTAEEYELMKQHTVKGAQMLLETAKSEYEEIAAEIALTHHEYWDGTGYPGHVKPETGRVLPGYDNGHGKARGKRGTEIPLFGRIVAIADAYDALSCNRPFRKALKEAEILKTLEKEAGRRFDPELLGAFFSTLESIRAIAHRFPEKD